MEPCACGSTSLDVWARKNPKWADHGGYYHAGVKCLDCGNQIHDWREEKKEALRVVMDRWNGALPLFE